MNTDTRNINLKKLRQTFEKIPHCQELGLKVISIERGKASIFLEYKPCLAGNSETGIVHGGVVSTLLDSVSGLCALSTVPKTTPVATLDLRIDYLKPATPNKKIIGEASCFRLTKSIAFVRSVAHIDKHKPLANCVATFMLGSAGFTSENQKKNDRKNQNFKKEK